MINQRILILTLPSPPKERYLSLREYETYVRKTKESHMEFAVGEVTERRVLVDKKMFFKGCHDLFYDAITTIVILYAL